MTEKVKVPDEQFAVGNFFVNFVNFLLDLTKNHKILRHFLEININYSYYHIIMLENNKNKNFKIF